MITKNKTILEFSVIAIIMSYKIINCTENSCKNDYRDENNSSPLPIEVWLQKISDPALDCNQFELNQEKGEK